MTTNMMYEVRVRGGTRSVLELEKVYKGEYSDPRKIVLKPNCEKVQIHLNAQRTAHEFTPTMIAAAVCASFAVLLILVAVLVWRYAPENHQKRFYLYFAHVSGVHFLNNLKICRRCFHGAYYYLDDPPRIPPLLGGAGWEGDSADEPKRSIPAHIFPKHVTELHADGDIGFSREYEIIQTAAVQEEFASEHSLHPENKQKNRYLNIVACKSTFPFPVYLVMSFSAKRCQK